MGEMYSNFRIHLAESTGSEQIAFDQAEHEGYKGIGCVRLMREVLQQILSSNTVTVENHPGSRRLFTWERCGFPLRFNLFAYTRFFAYKLPLMAQAAEFYSVFHIDSGHLRPIGANKHEISYIWGPSDPTWVKCIQIFAYIRQKVPAASKLHSTKLNMRALQSLKYHIYPQTSASTEASNELTPPPGISAEVRLEEIV